MIALIDSILDSIPYVLWALILFGLCLRSPGDLSQRQVVWIVAAWVLLWTVPYWVLGENSFVNQVDEGDSFLVVFYYLARILPDGATFAHHIAGGSDPAATLPSGGEWLNLEVTLFRFLPPWLALLAHKTMVCVVATVGTYLLARKGCKATRLESLALGMAYSVAHVYLTITSLNHGIGFAALPLAMYIFLCRSRKKFYFLEVAAFSAVYATSTTITHSFLALSGALLLAAFWFQPRYLKVAAAYLILLGLVVLNWQDVIWALAKWAPVSARGSGDVGTAASNIATDGLVFLLNKIRPTWLLFIAISLALLVWLDRRRATAAIAILAVSIWAPSIVIALPWEDIGLGFVKTVRLHVAILSVPALAVPFIAAALALYRARTIKTSARWRNRLISNGLAAMAIATLVGAFPSWAAHAMSHGSLRTDFGMTNLQTREWQEDGPTRIVTVPYMLQPLSGLTYGLETFDGYIMIVPRSKAIYWKYLRQHARKDIKVRLVGAQLYLANTEDTDCFICNIPLNLSSWADLDMLRIANVGYVISRIPLDTSSGDLTQVSKPNEPWPDRNNMSFVQRRMHDLTLAFRQQKVYVYKINNALPRAYFATGIVEISESTSEAEFHAAISKHAVMRKAVFQGKGEALASNNLGDQNARVENMELMPDGFKIRVSTPSGGLLILNSPMLPFWSASADGRPLSIRSVNGIQMAVALPAGARNIRFSYALPKPY